MIYVVSAPRSGLNWLRFCVEHYLGVRTPGPMVLIPQDDSSRLAFARSHNAKTGSNSSRGTPLGDLTGPDDKILLLVRDPLETFVRSAESNFKFFNKFIQNIHYFCGAQCNNKYLSYYEDHTGSPSAMFAVLQFLDIKPADGYEQPSLERLQADWKDLVKASISGYDKQQSHSGGSITKNSLADHKFHQRVLTEKKKLQVWRFLERRLSAEEMTILARYLPKDRTSGASTIEDISDSIQIGIDHVQAYAIRSLRKVRRRLQ